MPTIPSIDSLVSKMNKANIAVRDANKIGIAQAVKVGKEVVTGVLNADAPGGRLRNVGKKGTRLSVRSDAAGDGGSIQAVGSWPILNNPIAPHWIGQGRTKKVKGGFGPRLQVVSRTAEQGPGIGGGRIFRIGGREVTGPVLHPGTKGKQTWQRGIELAIDPMSTAIAEAPAKAFREAFR